MPKLKLIFCFILVLSAGGLFFTNRIIAGNDSVVTTVLVSVCGNNFKDWGEQCDGSDYGGKSCSNLGYGGGSLSCSASCEFISSSCLTCAESNTSVLFDVAIGGSVVLPNTNDTSISIDVPENFYSTDVRFQVFSYGTNCSEFSKPLVSGKSYVGKKYKIFLIDTSGSNVSEIADLSELVLSYEDADLSGLDESTIRPYIWTDSDSSWRLISGSVVDVANNRVTFSTDTFGYFALFASASESPAPLNPPGGGGGGGANTSGVAVSGRAYPLSKVFVLKDGQIAVSTIAGPDSRFNATVSGIGAGNYTFAVYGEDNNGMKSNLFTFPVTLTSGVTATIGGIFISPTIAVDKSEVKYGDDISIFGQSSPNSDVTISVHSSREIFNKTKSDDGGIYLYNLDTSVLEMGDHAVKSKSAVANEVSPFSKTVGFVVGSKNVPINIPRNNALKGDLNSDNKVNLVDFSIAAYWYKRTLGSAFRLVEAEKLNGDNKIDLVDFSILAFNWTG